MTAGKKSGIGLMGGMFDPIHMGHINCAEQAADLFNLEKVYFVPTAVPPHKKIGNAEAEDRFAMVRIALANQARFEVSRFEIDKEPPTYSIDTVKDFLKRHGPKLYFVIGMDAFEEIDTWKSSESLLRICNFIVISRPGWDARKTAEKLENSFKEKNVELKQISNKGDATNEFLRLTGSTCSVHICPSAEVDISSTAIREAIRKGKPIKNLVPEGVEQYIIDKGLYS